MTCTAVGYRRCISLKNNDSVVRAVLLRTCARTVVSLDPNNERDFVIPSYHFVYFVHTKFSGSFSQRSACNVTCIIFIIYLFLFRPNIGILLFLFDVSKIWNKRYNVNFLIKSHTGNKFFQITCYVATGITRLQLAFDCLSWFRSQRRK